MLINSLKQEFKETAQYFIPLCLSVGIITILGKVLQDAFFFFYIIILLGAFFLSLFFMGRRFYKDYVMIEKSEDSMLPISEKEFLKSKLICAFVWNLILTLIVLLSLYFVFSKTQIFSIYTYILSFFVTEIKNLETGMLLIGFTMTGIIFILLTFILCSILTLYASIAFGCQFLKKHPVTGTLISYIALHAAHITLGSALINFASSIYQNPDVVAEFTDVCSFMVIVTWTALAVMILTCIGYYLAIRQVLNKK